MAMRIVQLGGPRSKNEGIRIGIVRRPPRGVRKADYAKLDYYDNWLPQLAPSQALLSVVKRGPVTSQFWERFERKYVHELSSPDNQRLLDLLSALSRQTSFSIGCYCENEKRCHRSILKKVLARRGASLV